MTTQLSIYPEPAWVPSVGEEVDASEWNRCAIGSKLVGPVIVDAVREARVDGGYALTVVDVNGKRLAGMSVNWFKPIMRRG